MATGSTSEICEICEYQDIEKSATSFCEDCDEPELMCDSCALQHTLPKTTRNHNINDDITTFSNHIKSKKQDVPEKETAVKDVPGRPTADEVKADSVTLSWKKPDDFNERDRYQIRFKESKATRWTTHPAEIERESKTLIDLKADTEFVFQVRTVHMDGEGKYSPISKGVRTPKTPASQLLDFAVLVKPGNPSPSRYKVPMSEIRSSRDKTSKCKKFAIGQGGIHQAPEKTIMLVGATGTGKSTLVDGIVNYVLGVNWDDPFRFTAIDLEQEELVKQHNEAVSQTEWITCYSVDPEKGSRLDYRLTIIDTPGFGDTRGLKRDGEIVEQIRQLFSAKNKTGVSCIDAVCFLIKAPDARLTTTQKYVFHAIMSLFGKDIEENICTLITFADGEYPPVLASLKESKLPFGVHFKFNNSALFTKNIDSDSCSLSHLFWDMGCKSFRQFFEHLRKFETKSLQLTKRVLDERNKLELTVENLQPQVKLGLSKVNQIKTELAIFEKHKTEIEGNRNFTYTIEVTHATKETLPPGKFTTGCRHCHTTCHKICAFENDEDKHKCTAMAGGDNCTQCINKCHWTEHSNLPYIYKFEKVNETKTYAAMKKKYEKATEKKLSRTQVLEQMSAELVKLEEGIELLMAIVKNCNENLSTMALRPNPLSMVDYIDLMIQGEKQELKQGYLERIETLNEIRHKAQIEDHVKSVLADADEIIRTVSTSTKKPSKLSVFTSYLQSFVSGND